MFILLHHYTVRKQNSVLILEIFLISHHLEWSGLEEECFTRSLFFIAFYLFHMLRVLLRGSLLLITLLRT